MLSETYFSDLRVRRLDSKAYNVERSIFTWSKSPIRRILCPTLCTINAVIWLTTSVPSSSSTATTRSLCHSGWLGVRLFKWSAVAISQGGSNCGRIWTLSSSRDYVSEWKASVYLDVWGILCIAHETWEPIWAGGDVLYRKGSGFKTVDSRCQEHVFF